MDKNEKLNKQTKYKEGSGSLRHYSTTILNIRTLTIVQGLVLISSILYLIQKGNYANLIIVISIFGMLFTATLYIFNKVYLSDFESILVYVVRELEEENGPWSAYKRERDSRLRKHYTNPIAHHGIFTLLGTSFFISFIWGLIQAFN